MSFRENSSFSNYNFLVNESGAAEVADPFAWNLCIPDEEAPGELLEGRTQDELETQLWQLVLDTASGKARTRCELSDNREIMLFKNGVVL